MSQVLNPKDIVPVIVMLALGLPLGVLWAIAAADVLQRGDNEFPSWQPGSNVRMVWTFIVLFFAGLGALVYYFQVMRPYPRRRR